MESSWVQKERKPPGAGQSVPRVPVLIIGTCGVIWLIALSVQGGHPRETPLGQWMVFRSDHFDPRSFLTHHLFHENWIHLLVNMACIAYTGRRLEARWGGLRFSTFYLAGALAGGLTSYLVGRIEQASVPDGQPLPEASICLGASAAALACLAAYTLELADRPVARFFTERYLLWTAALLGATGLVALELTPQLSGIAAGAGMWCLFPLWERTRSRWQHRRSLEHQARAHQIRLRVDQLLEKISRQGLHSLSREEQTFLRDASKHFRNHS